MSQASKKEVSSLTERSAKPTRLQRFFFKSTFLALLLLSIILGTVTGLVVSYQTSLTDEANQVLQLATYKPSLVTQVLADDGQTVIGEFSLERRIPLSYDEIPPRMREAILAIEDSRFQHHWGVDPLGIIRAGWRNFQAGSTVEGGSTLTQQLAKMLFLTPEKTYTRKMKEALLAIQIERHFTKQQIMEFYCNQIFLGGGAYGIEAGAQYYFGKSVQNLTLEEYALLAAIPKAPGIYSPKRNMNNAKQRRNLVLDNMAEEGFITRSVAEEAKKHPIKLNISSRNGNNNSPYAYFVEEVRQYLEDNYGTRVAHTSGLKVYTTLNAEAQRHALQAVRRGLHAYDHRHPRWRNKLYNVIDNDNVKNLANYRNPDWEQEFVENMYAQGLVMEVNEKAASIRFGDYQAQLTPKDAAWVRQPLPQLLKKGDLAIFHIKKINKEKREFTVGLEQLPQVSGALICQDAQTGEIKVMVGGYDFNSAKFNNATQANRQTGSAFKPLIYTAAIENGWRAEDLVADAPFQAGDWTPHNYDGKFMGLIPLRTALAQSRNIPAIRLLQSTGIQKGAEMVRRFGITNPMAPYLPSALGATEVPLIELVSAYSTFANKGMRAKSYYIRRIIDNEGRLLEETKPQLAKVISPYVAGTMVSLMRGVVEGGTAARIKGEKEADLAKREIAGKTGTVNDFTDAWFIGYTPSLVTGFWIGYPGEKRSLGEGETGAQAALPVWIDFMKFYLKGKPIEKFGEIPKPDPQTVELQAKRARQHLDEMLSVTGKSTSGQPLPSTLLPESGNIPTINQLPPPPPPLPTKPPKTTPPPSKKGDSAGNL
ncbi:MAG: PBP1A family penicillin-binding protein [Acidobacteriota bacterium]